LPRRFCHLLILLMIDDFAGLINIDDISAL